MSDLQRQERVAQPASVSFARPPDWADAPPFLAWVGHAERPAHEGCRHLLSDTQFHLADEREVFSRKVCEVVTADGLQAASLLDVVFDPAFEQLTVCHVRVTRDGQTREVDAAAGLELFRREPNMERAIYDGRLTAHFVIPDVRVGDVVDTAFAIRGSHPTLRGWFAAEFNLAWGCWVGETRVRILAPEDRRLAVTGHNDPPACAEHRLGDGWIDRTWRTLDTPATPWESHAPGWIRQLSSVRVSDVGTWAQVADLFRSGYETDEPLPGELVDEVQALTAASGDASRHAAEALRLVQGALRYQSISLGAGGFTPRPVSRVWATRAGDCKDAARLLTVLLRALGLDAVPALVNTYRGEGLEHEPPNPSAFNHCLVRLRLDGGTYWLDPTCYPQGGSLAALEQARYGWALPLVEGAELEFMGELEPALVLEVAERFSFEPATDAPVLMEVSSTYRGWRADDMRRRLAGGAAALAHEYLDYYGRIFGPVAEAEPMACEDDLPANVLTTRERYRLERPVEAYDDGKHLKFSTYDDLFRTHLVPTRTASRRWPIDLGRPREMRVVTEGELPADIPLDPWDRCFEMDGVRATSKFEMLSKRRFRLTRRLEIRRSWLAAEEAEPFFKLRDEALEFGGCWIALPHRGGRYADWGKADGASAGSIGRSLAIWALIAGALALIRWLSGGGS